MRYTEAAIQEMIGRALARGFAPKEIVVTPYVALQFATQGVDAISGIPLIADDRCPPLQVILR